MGPFSVSDVTKYIKSTLEGDRNLQHLSIVGELSNFKTYTSGHWYFDLKDRDAIIKCVMFRSSAIRVRFRPRNGMRIVVNGRISVYEKSGAYQLYASSMQEDGKGDLMAQFEALRDKLTAEGLFDEGHKQPLPFFPKTIGIVTSPTGAVLRDINRVSKHRNPDIRLLLRPVQVQGMYSAQQVADAIRFFNSPEIREKYPVDLLIVGRGGGSMEDLWSFNEEVVVRAIYESQIPVISAVGHETDFTLADFAADKRAATPSNAAELAVPEARLLQARIREDSQRMANALRRQVRYKRQALEGAMNSIAMRAPKRLMEAKQQELDLLVERLNNLPANLIDKKRTQLTHLLEKLEIMSPLSVLKRGYGMVELGGRACDSRSPIITSAAQLHINDEIKVIMSDGQIDARVLTVKGEF